jgi:hypothetical protein
MIELVNTLQPLGKEKVLAAASEYVRVAGWDSAQDGIPLLLRALFEVPPASGCFPPYLPLGVQCPAPPRDPKLLPHYPLIICHDIPLLVVFGGLGCDEGPNAQTEIDWFQKHGRIRSKPLCPPHNPLEILTPLLESPEYRLYSLQMRPFEKPRVKLYLMEQLLLLVRPIYQPKTRPDDSYEDDTIDALWSAIVKEFTSLHSVWNPQRARYSR